MFSAIVFFIIVACVCLVGIILIQNPKGGGLGAGFSSGSANLLGGVQKATDVLEKITWVLIAAIAILSIVSVGTLNRRISVQGDIKNTEVMETVKEIAPATPELPAADPNAAPPTTPPAGNP